MKMRKNRNDIRGFTLLELMITVLLSSVVAIAVYSAYTSQHIIYRSQEAVVDMQQNLRSGMYLLNQELRMAGYDPTGITGASITGATNTRIDFTQDLNGDGDLVGAFPNPDPNENISIIWDGANAITRNTNGGAGAQPFIDNVSFAEFVYTLNDGTVTLNPPVGFEDEIRTIEITMVVQSPLQERNIVNTLTYTTNFGTNVPALPALPVGSNNFRRRMLYTTVQCRNASL